MKPKWLSKMYKSNEIYPAIGKRVLVFFLADEFERFIEPVKQLNPSKVYIFVFDSYEKDVNYKNHYPDIVKAIKEFNSNIEIVDVLVTFVDYYKVIQELSKIIKEEREKNSLVEIHLNCSTGSKISAVATIDAARIWNTMVFYVYSDDYDPNRNIKHKGLMKIIIPPVFPVQKPKWVLIETLRILSQMIEENRINRRYEPNDENYVLKSNLEDKLKKLKLLTTNTQKTSDNQRKKSARDQMALKQRFLDPLAESNYIRLGKQSKEKKIYLTPEGSRIAEIFKYYNPVF